MTTRHLCHPVEITSEEFGSVATAEEVCRGPDPPTAIVVVVVAAAPALVVPVAVETGSDRIPVEPCC